MCGAFADADVFGQLSITDLDVGATLLGFGGEPEIDEEAGGATVVAGEIAHKDLDDVRIDWDHSCISQYYSVAKAIALLFRPF